MFNKRSYFYIFLVLLLMAAFLKFAFFRDPSSYKKIGDTGAHSALDISENSGLIKIKESEKEGFEKLINTICSNSTYWLLRKKDDSFSTEDCKREVAVFFKDEAYRWFAKFKKKGITLNFKTCEATDKSGVTTQVEKANSDAGYVIAEMLENADGVASDRDRLIAVILCSVIKCADYWKTKFLDMPPASDIFYNVYFNHKTNKCERSSTAELFITTFSLLNAFKK